MPNEEGSERTAGTHPLPPSLWLVPVTLLLALWIWLALRAAGHLPQHWLPPALGLGFFGLLAGSFIAYPRRPPRLSLVVLGFLLAYSLWVAASATWAWSESRSWAEALRVTIYLLVFALTLTYLTDRVARRHFPHLFLAAVVVLCAVAISRLWAASDLSRLFVTNHFVYPASLAGGAAALYLLPFWPLMWLASSRRERAPVRGIALGLATCVLGLGLLTQSRGALWSLALSLAVMFLLSPVRLRLFFYLLVPALLMVYQFPRLNRYWTEDAVGLGGALAGRTLVVAALAGAFMGMVLALLEGWIRIRGRVKAVLGLLVLAGCIAGLVYGVLILGVEKGGVTGWISQIWHRFTSEAATSSANASDSGDTLHLVDFSSSGRVSIWKVAWRQFERSPAVGIGANNFALAHDKLRNSNALEAKEAHNFALQVLTDTGIIGGCLAFGGMLTTVGVLLWPRIGAGWAGARGSWLRRPKWLRLRDQRRASPTNVGDLGEQGSSAPMSSGDQGRPATRGLSHHSEGQAEKSGDQDRALAVQPGTATIWGWGKDSVAYGWHMAVLGAASYWLIHASVEGLWQRVGVTLPLFLLLASGLADITARLEERRGRLEARSLREQEGPLEVSLFAETPERTVATEEREEESRTREASSDPRSGRGGNAPSTDEGFFRLSRRAERHKGRNEKKERRQAKRLGRKARSGSALVPVGPTSKLYRVCLLVISAFFLLGTGTLYTSHELQKSALALSGTDPRIGVSRTYLARWLSLGDPGPFLTATTVYRQAAVDAMHSSQPDRAGAVLDDLALALRAASRAASAEPAAWTTHYEAAWAALDLLLARGYAERGAAAWGYLALPDYLQSSHDWSPLAPAGPEATGAESTSAENTGGESAAQEYTGGEDFGSNTPRGQGPLVPAPGEAQASLAVTTASLVVAAQYRGLGQVELKDLALAFANKAAERNPLETKVRDLLDFIRSISL